MWYVYILKSVNLNRFYKGLTNNLDRRVKEHMSSRVKTTKSMLPLQLVHVDICSSRKEARKIEKFFKSGFGREILKELFQ